MKFFVDTADVVQAAKMGTHVAILPPNGLKAFLDDWAKTGQSIL